jgi:phage-related protein
VAAKLILDIITDTSKSVKGFQQVSKAAQDTSEKTSKHFGTVSKAAGLLAGGAALGGVVAILKTGASEQSDFLAGQAQLANGLKTTNGAAGITVKQMENLASSVQGYSGQTDDSIVSSEKLLLTFTKIHNSAGKNNDIFTQATKLTADMAAKMGGDASKYAIQLGKALNDPTKGLSALTRVGVSFDDKQKALIKHLQATGNTAGAQKVILAELRKEFGNSAKAAGQTLPGQLARAHRSFEDMSQSLLAALMPALSALIPVVTQVIKVLGPILGSVVKALAPIIGQLAKALGPVLGAALKVLLPVIKALAPLFGQVLGAALAVILPLIKVLMPVFAALVKIIGAILTPVLKALQPIWPVLVDAFNTILGALKPLFPVLTSIAGILGKTLAQALTAIAPLLKPLAELYVAQLQVLTPLLPLINALAKILSGVLVAAIKLVVPPLEWLIGLETKLYKAAGTAVTKVVGFFIGLPGGITSALSNLWNIIKAPFLKAWDWVNKHVLTPLRTAFHDLTAKIKGMLSNLWNVIKDPFQKAWDWIGKHVITPIKNAFTQLPSNVRQALSNLWSVIATPFGRAWDWISQHVISPIKNAFTNLAGNITGAVRGVTDAITAPFRSAWNWINQHVFSPIGSFFTNLPSKIGGLVSNVSSSIVNGIINLLNSALNLPWVIELHIHGPGPLPDLNFGPYTVLPRIPNLAAGGFFNQPTLAVVGEAGGEVVAPEGVLRRLIREELGQAGIHITVNGALDPDRVARQIEDLLEARRRRVGGITRRGTALTGVS